MLDYHPLEISKVQKSDRFLKLSGATCATFLDVKSSGRIWIPSFGGESAKGFGQPRRKARSGGQRTNLRRRYTTRSWLIPSSHVRVNACGGVLVLTQRITARAIQKFTHCALNTNPISKFPILLHLRWKNYSMLISFFSPRFPPNSSFNNRCIRARNFTE